MKLHFLQIVKILAWTIAGFSIVSASDVTVEVRNTSGSSSSFQVGDIVEFEITDINPSSAFGDGIFGVTLYIDTPENDLWEYGTYYYPFNQTPLVFEFEIPCFIDEYLWYVHVDSSGDDSGNAYGVISIDPGIIEIDQIHLYEVNNTVNLSVSLNYPPGFCNYYPNIDFDYSITGPNGVIADGEASSTAFYQNFILATGITGACNGGVYQADVTINYSGDYDYSGSDSASTTESLYFIYDESLEITEQSMSTMGPVEVGESVTLNFKAEHESEDPCDTNNLIWAEVLVNGSLIHSFPTAYGEESYSYTLIVPDNPGGTLTIEGFAHASGMQDSTGVYVLQIAELGDPILELSGFPLLSTTDPDTTIGVGIPITNIGSGPFPGDSKTIAISAEGLGDYEFLEGVLSSLAAGATDNSLLFSTQGLRAGPNYLAIRIGDEWMGGSWININSGSGVFDAYEQSSGNDGIIAFEAEGNLGIRQTRNGREWTDLNKIGASGGTVIQVPDLGNNWNAEGYSATAPQISYPLNFLHTGTHFVWIRSYAYNSTGTPPLPANGNDSVHIGLNQHESGTISGFTLNAWSWKSASIEVEEMGLNYLNLWPREDGTLIDKIVITNQPPATYTPTGTGPSISDNAPFGAYTGNIPPPSTVERFLQSGGSDHILSVELENLVIKRFLSVRHRWIANSQTGASNGILKASPDLGNTWWNAPETDAPMLEIPVDLQATGDHYVWIRAYHPQQVLQTGYATLTTYGDNDSLLLGVEGTAVGPISGFTNGTWSWKRCATPISIARSGPYLLNLWAQEDGVVVDKMVITTNSSYVPTDTGPSESTIIEY